MLCVRLKDLEKIFLLKVLKMLLFRSKITEEIIRMMDGWTQCGFNVYCGLENPSP